MSKRRILILFTMYLFVFSNKSVAQEGIKALNVNGYFYLINSHIDSVYVGRNGGYKLMRGIKVLVFYEDNKFLECGFSFPDSVDIDSLIFSGAMNAMNEKFKIDLKYLGLWGGYKQKKDSLIVQTFIEDNSRAFVRVEERLIFLIKDSSVYLLNRNCSKCKQQYSEYRYSDKIIYSPPLEYKFAQFPTKPDSSQSWLYKKKWYNKKLKKFMEQ